MYNSPISQVPGLPHGFNPTGINMPQRAVIPQPVEQPQMPSEGLKRAITYLADYGGCGFYRCIAPSILLNLHEKAVLTNSSAMILDPRFYATVSAVRFQRQATVGQKQFVEIIRKVANEQKNLKLLYEIDDVVFHEDIPPYNKNRSAFAPPDIQRSIIEMMSMMDEITVTTEYFRDYLINKTGLKNVTAIPNHLMRWWFDRYYNQAKLIKDFEKNKKRPIVGIFASATHVDVANLNNGIDDFTPVLTDIIKSRKDFRWRFFGSYPLQLRDYIQRGEMEFFRWTKLPDFPRSMAESGVQVTFASLQDNIFNNAKSSIKFVESGALGLPCVCPDLPPYKDAHLKYKTGAEFIDCLKKATKNQGEYVKYSQRARAYVDAHGWLDDEKHMMQHYEALFTPFESPERKFIKKKLS
jgi:hypothetical protein